MTSLQPVDLTQAEDDLLMSDSELGYSDYDDGSDSGALPYDSAQGDYSREVQFAILEEEDVLRKQQEMCDSVSSLLSLPDSHCKALLRHFRWDVNRLNDEWFSNETGVREAVGLPQPSNNRTSAKATVCGICFEEHEARNMHGLRCDHRFCSECWPSYIASTVEQGPKCLDMRCPDPSCSQLVTDDFVRRIGAEQHVRKYSSFLLRSFVEDSRKVQWCPAPGCNKAVECFDGVGTDTPLDVTCSCGNTFCFNCLGESHHPADCTMAKKWILKNTAESENLNWILAHSKPCPQCKRPIEKNQGCMHMTCAICRYEFCWLCGGNWADHGERTGGFYNCNKFQAKDGSKREENRRRDYAKLSLERYMHYFERWAVNEASCKQAKESLAKWISGGDIEALSEMTKTPVTQLRFVADAWAQVIQSRRVLMWTYAFGYYNFSEERAGNLKDFFEFLQGEAESNLESLHNCVEVELVNLMMVAKDGQATVLDSTPALSPGPSSPQLTAKMQENFNAFRSKLAGLTKVTKDYFGKLVYELENGLEEIKTKYGSMDENGKLSIGSPY